MQQAHPGTAEEQEHLDEAYGRLDALRERARRRLRDAMAQGASGTHQNRSERDSFVSLWTDRLAALEAVESRLTFGRLDSDAGATWIGRIGLADDTQKVIQIDWRAPAAAPFYQATAARPLGVLRRRHITTEGRDVVALSDEVLDPDKVDPDAVDSSSDSALLAALSAARTGRMGDIVATIQAEQDRIIRSDVKGALVVQGGPGTGKTAVALHRAAYLLYTHRDRLERSGVLVLGPTGVFLRYVEAVLPSLGETGVVLSSVAELVPGVEATTRDRDEVAVVKGDVAMAKVLAAAVRARQRVPEKGLTLDVSGTRVHLAATTIAHAGREARREHETHNAARIPFLVGLLNQLATRLARARRMDAGDAYVREDLLGELREDTGVRRELNLLWMPVTPQRLLTDLLTKPDVLAVAAQGLLTHDQQRLLLRDPGSPFTVDDVPLLDELAELLGEDDVASRAEAARRAAQDAREAAYAQSVLESTQNADDDGIGTHLGMVSGADVAARFADTGPTLTLAERAAADREWVYGHVVVDEAQELSPMAWRAVVRRCPSRSMTVVGDLAQTSSGAGARSWGEALDEVTRGAGRVEELSINYRTPARIARLAERVLAATGRDVTSPQAVREGDHDPVDHLVDDVAAGVRDVVASWQGLPGRSAVVAPARLVDGLTASLREAGVEAATGREGLDSAVAVMTPSQVKGLEFDHVLVVEPGEVASAPGGLADLYVALTRATSRLDVVRTGPLPEALDGAFVA